MELGATRVFDTPSSPSLNYSNTAGSFMCLRKIKGRITRWFLNILLFKLWINTWMKTWFNLLGKSCNTELRMKTLMTKKRYSNDLLNKMLISNLYILILHKHNSLNVEIVIFSHLTCMRRRAQLCVQANHGKTSMVQGQHHLSSVKSQFCLQTLLLSSATVSELLLTTTLNVRIFNISVMFNVRICQDLKTCTSPNIYIKRTLHFK